MKISSTFYVCCIFRPSFGHEAKTMNPDQSSLIWVHIVCNKCYQSKSTDERTDNIYHKWLNGGRYISVHAMLFKMGLSNAPYFFQIVDKNLLLQNFSIPCTS